MMVIFSLVKILTTHIKKHDIANTNNYCNVYIYYILFVHTIMNSAGEEARRQLHKNATCNLKQVLAATPHKTLTVRPPAPYHKNYSS